MKKLATLFFMIRMLLAMILANMRFWIPHAGEGILTIACALGPVLSTIFGEFR